MQGDTHAVPPLQKVLPRGNRKQTGRSKRRLGEGKASGQWDIGKHGEKQLLGTGREKERNGKHGKIPAEWIRNRITGEGNGGDYA